MGKGLSLYFAIVANLFLIGVAIALSYRSIWLTLLFIILFVLHTGLGFIIKARLRRKQEQEERSSKIKR